MSVAGAYFDRIVAPRAVNISFNKRTYKMYLKNNMKPTKDVADSWDFWNGRVFSNWKLVESLEFIKDFKGIDQNNWSFDNLVVLLKYMDDNKMRLELLKCL